MLKGIFSLFGFIKTKNPLHMSNLFRLSFAVIFGIAIGLILRNLQLSETSKALIEFPGKIFLAYLKMLVLPLIFTSIICGISEISKTGQEGLIAKTTSLFFVIGSLVTVSLAIAMTLIVDPTGSIKNSTVHPSPSSNLFLILLDLIYKLIPTNIFQAASDDKQLLGILTFSIIVGIAVSRIGEKGEGFLSTIAGLNQTIMKMFPTALAPYGIASIITHTFISEPEIFKKISAIKFYIFIEFVGFSLIGFILLPLVQFLFTKKNPYPFQVKMTEAILTAFGTASSTGTIPYTIKCCEVNNNISPKISRFIIPLGAPLNIWGSGFHKAATITFLALLHGREFSLEMVLMVFVLCLLFSVGAAGIPSGSIVVMISMLNALGLPESLISFIFPIDWLLDRLRTPINIYGDAVGAAILDHKSKLSQKQTNKT